MSTMSMTISGSAVTVKDQSFKLDDKADNRSVLTFTVKDTAGTLSFVRGQPVVMSDSVLGTMYAGFVSSDQPKKLSADPNITEREHLITCMDNHYKADKRSNFTNYLKWNAGDIICDFISKTLSAEGVSGPFAIESDYSQAAFATGTLTNAAATTNKVPLVAAPQTGIMPQTNNTGDLEIARAGTQFTLIERVTSDFSSGTLMNMQAVNNTLTPTTQQALEVQVQFPLAYGANAPGLNKNISGAFTYLENINNSAYAQIWSGSQAIATTDTLNYDIWIASTSPAFMAGVDFTCSDGTRFSVSAAAYNCLGGLTQGIIGYWDTNNVSADILTDLSGYAKDAWYTRSIPMAGSNLGGQGVTNNSAPPNLAGKTITSVSVVVVGSAVGTYTIYVKNIYLGSAVGSPFLSTSATVTNVNPPVVTTLGGYVPSTMTTTIVPAHLPQSSYRVSPVHSIASVGIVQNSYITWTASLPTTGPANTLPISALSPQSAQTQPGTPSALVIQISYDNVTWLTCVNQAALPGLPAGANVASTSFYLKEYFSAGSDPSAIPALAYVSITINSAANQTTSDVTQAYGNATNWNTGTYKGLTPNAGGQLTVGGTFSPAWGSSSTAGQTLFWGAGATSGSPSSVSDSALSGTYTMTASSAGSGTGAWGFSRFDFVGDTTNGTLQADFTAGNWSSHYAQIGFVYRSTAWQSQSTGNGSQYVSNSFCYLVFISGNTSQTYGSHVEFAAGSNSASSNTYTTLGTSAISLTAGTFYTIKVIFNGNRHQIFVNGSLYIDQIDNTYLGPGGVGVRAFDFEGTNMQVKNCTVIASSGGEGTWTSGNISLNALGTCGNTQIDWTEETSAGRVQSTAIVLASLDGGTTWKQCANGATIPGLPSGTSVTGKNLTIQVILFTSNPLTAPTLFGLYVRVCGSYGTATGTRVSLALSLTPVGRVGSSTCMWNANTPTGTSVAVAVSQNGSTWTDVTGSNGGALAYWYAQPSPQIDVWTSNTSANYTNTFITGGSASTVTYDTTNSRITMGGGSGGLYLYSSIARADVDLLCDMDESDAGGLVWRRVDNSNYYELGVYDDSSSGGFTNQLRLYKVASGTRSLLGSASTIAFARNTAGVSPYHRVRVTMMAGVISVYFDGVLMQTYTDGSPLGAGLMGLRNDGGTSRYYQLRLQPLGDSVSGQSLYTKVTLSTSDPSQMPQLFVLVACVRGPGIATGATIDQLHPITTPFAQYISREMDSLVLASGDYYWLIDNNSVLWFQSRQASPAPFPLASQDFLYEPTVTPTSSADLYRNTQIVTDVTGLTALQVETKAADGSTSSWTMGYPLYSAPTITVNGVAQTVGVQGVDVGLQFYWQVGSQSISYDPSLAKIPAGAILVFSYIGQFPENVTQNNASAITAQAAIETGTSGIIEEIESALQLSNGSTFGMTPTQATTFANGLLTRCGNNSSVEIIATTLRSGLLPGMILPVFCPEHLIWNAQLPIVKVSVQGWTKSDGSMLYEFTIDATNGPNLNNWAQVWF